MDRDRDIQPVGSVTAILRAKPLGKIRMFKRPGYRSRLRKADAKGRENESPREEESIDSHYVPDGIGGRIDLKI